MIGFVRIFMPGGKRLRYFSYGISLSVCQQKTKETGAFRKLKKRQNVSGNIYYCYSPIGCIGNIVSRQNLRVLYPMGQKEAYQVFQTNNSLQEKNKQVYLDGIRKFMVRGVPVLIDGERMGEDELDRLFDPPEGTFYMADFVMEESPEMYRTEESPAGMLRENTNGNVPYLSHEAEKRFILKEIRFDRAYHS